MWKRGKQLFETGTAQLVLFELSSQEITLENVALATGTGVPVKIKQIVVSCSPSCLRIFVFLRRRQTRSTDDTW